MPTDLAPPPEAATDQGVFLLWAVGLLALAIVGLYVRGEAREKAHAEALEAKDERWRATVTKQYEMMNGAAVAGVAQAEKVKAVLDSIREMLRGRTT